MGEAVRDKKGCMKLGTGICERSEVWARHDEPCDDCEHYVNKEGKSNESD